jgi:hypothetical protein
MELMKNPAKLRIARLNLSHMALSVSLGWLLLL